MGAIKLLSVDFDYFANITNYFRMTNFPDGGNEDLGKDLQDIIWGGRYASNPDFIKKCPVKKKELEYMKQIFENNSHAEYTLAKSHLSIINLLSTLARDFKPIEIYNVDFHHDLYFKRDFTCGNWLEKFYDFLDVKKTLWICDKESMIEYDIDYNNEISQTFSHTFNIKDLDGIKFDYLFLCQSTMWSPPHLDKYFISLANSMLKGRNVSIIRENDTEYNRYTKDFINLYLKIQNENDKMMLRNPEFFDYDTKARLIDTPGSEYFMLKKDLFTIKNGYIYLNDFPLFRTIANSLKDYQFFIIKENFYTLLCLDDKDDFFHYGRWNSAIETMNWLSKPK